MTRRPRYLAAALFSALLLSACGAGEKQTAPSPSDAAQPPAAVLPSASAGAESPSPSPTPSPSSPPVTPSAETSAPTPPETVAEPAYRVSKAYRLVPIDKAKTPEKVVLLTFDDGPKDEKVLASMLDTLDKHKAKAIFFVNGYRVKQNPDLLKEIDARGQVIGNHSWDHIVLSKEKETKVREQIGNVQDIVFELTGKKPVFFRPPHGAGNETVRKAAADNGLLFMNWSNGSLDWELGKKTPDKPQAVIDNVLEQLHPGANILMHELEWTAEALDRLLTELEAKGYGFADPNAIQTAPKQP